MELEWVVPSCEQSFLVHQELDVNQASFSFAVVFDALGPSPALNVDEDTGCRVLQLNHDNGLEVAQLVPVWEEIGRKSSPGKKSC